MLKHVHQFRGLAIALVVLSHAKLVVLWPDPSNVSSRLIRALIEGGDVPFVFISGFLFQHTAGRFRYGPYLRRRWMVIVVPYLVCSTPILLHELVFHYGVFTPGRSAAETASALLHSLLTAHHMFVPLWFIPTIVLIYLLAPLWLALDRRPALYQLLPPVVLLGSFVHLSPFYEDVPRDALNLLPVFWLGMAVSHHRASVMPALHRLRHGLLAATLGLLAVAAWLGPAERLSSLAIFSGEHGTLDLVYLQKVLFSLWALTWLAVREARVAEGDRASRWMLRLGDLSFGIFFAHMYVLDFLVRPLMRWAQLEPEAGGLAIVGIACVYLGITIGVVLVAKRLLGSRSRYAIGC